MGFGSRTCRENLLLEVAGNIHKAIWLLRVPGDEWCAISFRTVNVILRFAMQSLAF